MKMHTVHGRNLGRHERRKLERKEGNKGETKEGRKKKKGKKKVRMFES